MNLLNVKNIYKTYVSKFGLQKVKALQDISFSVDSGEYLAIMGESGSGKTTLLNILASLDTPDSGEVLLNGEDIFKIPEKDIAKYRRRHLGFVFQDFNLLNNFTAYDNIAFPLVLENINYEVIEKRILPIAEQLNISHLLKKYPYELSGGEKQRIAIARAIVTNPKLVLADEPTGALDSKNSDELLKLFSEINRDGQTIIMVTHSVKAASKAERIIFIKDGKIFHEMYKKGLSDGEMFEMISDILTILARGGEINE